MVALRVVDFSHDARTLRIERSVSELKGVLTEGPTKTRKVRVVGLTRALADKIALHIDSRGLAAGDILFPSKISKGWRYDPSSDDSWFNAAVRACVAQDDTFPAGLTPHGLRHAAAAFMIRAGLSVSDVQAQLGHKAATTTLNTYADLGQDSPAVVGNALEGLLDTQPAGTEAA